VTLLPVCKPEAAAICSLEYRFEPAPETETRRSKPGFAADCCPAPSGARALASTSGNARGILRKLVKYDVKINTRLLLVALWIDLEAGFQDSQIVERQRRDIFHEIRCVRCIEHISGLALPFLD
jgi:hypothetical protein